MLKKIFTKISYGLFRVFYMFSHFLAFLSLKASSHQKSNEVVFLCGIEPSDYYSKLKLQHFIQHSPLLDKSPEIILLSKEYTKVFYHKGLGVRIIPWEYRTRARLCAGFMKIFYRKDNNSQEALIHGLANQAACMYDLGDYQLDSTKATGWTANMMANIVFAKNYQMDFYILPQSMSPFDYPKPFSIFINLLLKKCLPYVKVVCAREHWGLVETEKRFNCNIMLCVDLLYYQNELLSAAAKKNSTTFVFSPKITSKGIEQEPVREAKEACASLGMDTFIVYLEKRPSEHIIEMCKEVAGSAGVLMIFGDEGSEDLLLSSLVVTMNRKLALALIAWGVPAIFVGQDAVCDYAYQQLHLGEFLAESMKDKPLLLKRIKALQDSKDQIKLDLKKQIQMLALAAPLPVSPLAKH